MTPLKISLGSFGNREHAIWDCRFPEGPGLSAAITDVADVEVGYATVISDSPGAGKEPARTGAILPWRRS